MTKEQFIELIAAEQESLRRFLRGLCAGDGFLADDIAQEALLKAYLSFERFQGRSRFSTWLFRIAYNCWYDHLKKAGGKDDWISVNDSDGMYGKRLPMLKMTVIRQTLSMNSSSCIWLSGAFQDRSRRWCCFSIWRISPPRR